jgi:hypothetical protein
VGVETRTSDAPHLLRDFARSQGLCGQLWTRLAARIRPDLGRGRTVLSKAARPKSVRPVSLAGYHPPAAGLTPATAVISQNQ